MLFPGHFLVAYHTDRIGPGSTFFAFEGKEHKGIDFIPLALEKGAKIIVVQEETIIPKELFLLIKKNNAELIYEPKETIRKTFAHECAKAYGFPAHSLKIIGITGTKGKTTTTFLCAHILKECGYRVAYLSTVENAIMEKSYETRLTTQQADYLHAFFAQCIKKKITHVVMEVSAQALSSGRVNGIPFSTILFTNFSQEHGEYYPTQEEYFQAKCSIFNQLIKNGTTIINNDDFYYSLVKEAALKNKNKIISFGNVHGDAQWSLFNEHSLQFSGKITYNDTLYNFKNNSLCGSHNAANIASVLCIIKQHHTNLTPEQFYNALISFSGVPGRCERYITNSGVHVCIDYAHTPSSFECTLKMLRALTKKLIVVFGCGGEKDTHKRPIMTSLVEHYADSIYITADNPRCEPLKNIINDMLYGCSFTKPTHIIPDRKDAIIKALTEAQNESIVALLGKGNETYQIIGTEKQPFSEYDIISSHFGFQK